MNKNIRTETLVTLLPYHLTADTRRKYINPVAYGYGTIESPPMEMPFDVNLYHNIGLYPIIEIERYDKKPIKPDETNNDEPIPNDLLELLNWAIKNNIKYIQLDCEEASCYGDDALDARIEAESELPIYDYEITI